MKAVLGFDTSNYTTSAALYDPQTGKLHTKRRLLPVKEGALGLRQSDAVFEHTRALPLMVQDVFAEGKTELLAVSASDRPRRAEGSYMPCFLVGAGTAKSIASAVSCPVFYCSHQMGHILAGLYSADCFSYLEQPFLAFHLSGGTTDCVLVTPDKEELFRCQLVAHSLDLKAGQVIDRVGGMLGLSFPAGAKLEPLAAQTFHPEKIRPSVKGANCSLSGVENQCRALLDKGGSAQDVAGLCLSSVGAALGKMTEAVQKEYPNLPLLYAGGVMSNRWIREWITSQYGGRFAAPEFSGDNAAGVAIYGALRLQERKI